MANLKSCAWCFTINNYEDADIDNILNLTFKYMCFGFEVGMNDTPHIQGYIYFKNGRYRSGLSTEIPRAYLAVANGSPMQNRKYCSKEGDFYEFGSLPGESQGKMSMQAFAEVYDDPSKNLHCYNMYRKSYEHYLERIHSLDHERLLTLVSETEMFNLLKEVDPSTVIVDDYENWKGEDVLVLPAYSAFPIERWLNALVPRTKRGYEIIKIDPKQIIVYYSDVKEHNYCLKKYGDQIAY